MLTIFRIVIDLNIKRQRYVTNIIKLIQMFVNENNRKENERFPLFLCFKQIKLLFLIQSRKMRLLCFSMINNAHVHAGEK